MKTKKEVRLSVEFYGDGTVRPLDSKCLSFTGGVPAPKLKANARFLVDREVVDNEGIWNPVDGEGTVEGGFQINVWANSQGYRELAKHLLALAELDTSADPDFHQHYELMSEDGRTRLHLICRKAKLSARPPAEEHR